MRSTSTASPEKLSGMWTSSTPKPNTSDLFFCITIRLWSVENSFFKDFVPEGGGHLDQCFEFDFEAGKFQKYILNQKDKQDLKVNLILEN
jgi:hypothetical protein